MFKKLVERVNENNSDCENVTSDTLLSQLTDIDPEDMTNELRELKNENDDEPGVVLMTDYVNKNELAFVHSKVSNRKVITLLDNGSQATLISADCAKGLKRINKNVPQLKSVSGSVVATHGVAVVPYRLGSLKCRLEAIVVSRLPANCDVLLGRKILAAHNIIDHHTHVTVKGERIPLVTKEKNFSQVATLAIPKTFEIEPKSVVTILAKTSKPLSPHKSYVVDLNLEKNAQVESQDLLVDSSIRGHVMVVLSNGGDTPVQFEENSYFGVVRSVPENDVHTDMTEINMVLDHLKVSTSSVSINASYVSGNSSYVSGTVGTEESEDEGKEKKKSCSTDTATKERSPEEAERILNEIKEIDIRDPEVKDAFMKKLKNLNSVFLAHKFDITEPALLPPMEVKLKSSAQPFYQQPYPVAAADRQLMKDYLEILLKHKVIKRDMTRYACPALIIRKKEPGCYRFLFDARRINRELHLEKTNMINFEHLISTQITAHNSCIMSTLDAGSAFFQLQVDDPEKVLGLSTEFGSFRYLRAPQGLSLSPLFLQNQLRNLFATMEGDHVIVLLDDVMVLTRNSESFHAKVLGEVLQRLHDVRLKLRPDKCHLFAREVNFCGMKITEDGFDIASDKVDKLRKWSKPKDLKELRGFIAFCSYVRRHIPSFSKLMYPLLELMKMVAKPDFKQPFDTAWKKEHQLAFKRLIHIITTAPCLKKIDYSKQLHLFVDASDNYIGNVLGQYYEDKNGRSIFHPCRYGSRVLTDVEKRYNTSEKESLSLSWSLHKLRHILLGQDYVIHTDSIATKHGFSKEGMSQSRRLARFSLQVQDVMPKDGKWQIKHIEGCKNPADVMSRLDLPRDPEDHKDLGEYNPFNLIIGNIISGAVTRSQTKADGMFYKIMEAQQKSEELRIIMELVKKKQDGNLFKNGKQWIIKNGVLMVKSKTKMPDEEELKFVLPPSFATVWIRDFHYHKMNTHPSGQKMMAQFSKKYYVRNLTEICQKVWRECDACQRTTLSRFHATQEMSHIPRAKYPMSVLCLDLFGPVSVPNQNKQRYILFVIDTFSKYAWAKTLQRQTSEEITDFMAYIFDHFGTAEKILSDEGSNLKYGLLPQLAAKLGVEKINSLAYHHAGNSVCERLIGSICSKLRTILEETKDLSLWAELTSKTIAAYNKQVHSSTGFSPNIVHLGYQPSIGFEPLEPKQTPTNSMIDYIKKKQEMKERIWEVVDFNISQYEATMKKYRDKKYAKPKTFDPGCWVLVKKGLLENKLHPLYLGPAEVVSSDVHSATIKYIANGLISRVSVTRLKLYFYNLEHMSTDHFTAPKRADGQSRSLDLQSDSRDPEVDLQTGLSDKSPFRNVLRKTTESNAEDDDEPVQIEFANDNENEIENESHPTNE